MTLRCLRCKEERPFTVEAWRCSSCGGPLQVEGDDRFDKERIRRGPHSLWRYREALPPLPDDVIVSLGEGFTPLVPAIWEGSPVFFKLDYLQPTGSFKDRGAAVLVSALKGAGISSIIEDSSGNAGAAIAAYCARAGIRCEIFAPASASRERLAQIEAYGAKVTTVQGPREKAAQAALAAAEGSSYAGHNWHPLFLEGVKTFALEVWEQLDWKAPENLIAPAGYGSLVLGASAAFGRLRQAGEVPTLPRIFAVQAERCCPLYRAWTKGLDDVEAVSGGETLAEGIACTRPIRGREVLAAVRASKGAVETVTEEEIVAALKALAAQGLYVEPTAAVPAAAFRKLVALGKIKRGETTVVVLTGSGLKATGKISTLLRQRFERPSGR